jgi:Siphovirus ReqiPepy6 Gp37-like protein
VAELVAGGVAFTGPDFTLTACDWRIPVAEVDTYESFTVIARHNAVATWELVLPADTDAARALLASYRPRLLLSTDTVYRSGPATRFQRNQSQDGDLLTVNGVDDLALLSFRLAHPQPGSPAPPYSTTAADARTGVASTVFSGYVDRNAGPGAITARQIPGLTILLPTPFGPTVSMSGAWQNLLDFIAQAANAAGVGIRVRDLQFEVFQPSGSADFSVDLGTLAAWESVLEMPDANYVYVGGSGVGTARVYREYADTPSMLAWGRIEQFSDQRNTAVTAELDQAGGEALASGARPPTVEMEALDTEQQQFLRDWNVGDQVTVVVGDKVLNDVIAEAEIKMAPNEPTRVKPVLGAAKLDLTAFRLIVAANRRIRQLERS